MPLSITGMLSSEDVYSYSYSGFKHFHEARRRRSTKIWSHKVKFNKKNKRKRVNKIAKLSRRKNRDMV